MPDIIQMDDMFPSDCAYDKLYALHPNELTAPFLVGSAAGCRYSSNVVFYGFRGSWTSASAASKPC